jgi:hypothetical protein
MTGGRDCRDGGEVCVCVYFLTETTVQPRWCFSYIMRRLRLIIERTDDAAAAFADAGVELASGVFQ